MNGRAWEFVRAIRGPILLITFGTLTALNHTNRLDFERSWPVLIIVYGVLKLAERMLDVRRQYRRRLRLRGMRHRPGTRRNRTRRRSIPRCIHPLRRRKEAHNEARFVVAPVILILIGAMFLANNLRPDIPMLDFLGRYWPFLLIAWGIIRLLEIVVWAARGKPLPTSGVSGGEWALVIFLSIIGSTLYAFNSNGWGPARFRVHGIEIFGESYDYPIDEKKIPAARITRVVIENFRGNTRVSGSDTTEVRVTGRKIVRALTHDDANRVNAETGLEFVEQGDSIVIRTNQNRAQQERYVSAELEITVPQGVTVQARGKHGDFDINAVTGGVEIESDNAGVRLQDIGGNVRVNLQRSDIVRAIGVTGNVDLQGRGNDVELENVQGQVTIEGSWGGELQFRKLAKPLRFQGRQADLAVQRIDGEVRLGRGFVHGESLAGPSCFADTTMAAATCALTISARHSRSKSSEEMSTCARRILSRKSTWSCEMATWIL